jgi:hypothetical protein
VLLLFNFFFELSNFKLELAFLFSLLEPALIRQITPFFPFKSAILLPLKRRFLRLLFVQTASSLPVL